MNGGRNLKTAFLFAGQGSQKVGMGKDLYDNNETFRRTIDSIKSDFDIKKMMFEGPLEALSQTRYTQPCMGAFAAGVIAILKEKGIKADYVAGLSLGEYSALYYAGVFDTQTFFDLISFRGKVMEEASIGIECKMSAVMGLESSKLRDICNEISGLEISETDDENKLGVHSNSYVTISNYNCNGQYVICGDVKAVEKAEIMAKEAGAKRIIPLKVSGPFHTKYMKKAGDELLKYFENIEFKKMEVPVVFNTTKSEQKSGETIKDILVSQVQSSIYMEDIIKYLEEKGVDTVIEIGPGKALSGFVKKTTDNISTYKIENMKDIYEIQDLSERI